MIWLRFHLFFVVVYALLVSLTWVSDVIEAAKERIYFCDLEHLEVTYFNTKYIAFLKYSSRRYSRRDPTYYVSFYYESLVPFGREVHLDIYFYEFLSNEYRRSFVEVHYNFCDLVLDDEKFFGPIVRHRFSGSNGVLKACPFPKGVYNLTNASIANMPALATFPFQKGRLYVNQTLQHLNGTRELMVSGYVDMLIKSKWRQKY